MAVAFGRCSRATKVPRCGTAAVRVRTPLHNACHAVRVDPAKPLYACIRTLSALGRRRCQRFASPRTSRAFLRVIHATQSRYSKYPRTEKGSVPDACRSNGKTQATTACVRRRFCAPRGNTPLQIGAPSARPILTLSAECLSHEPGRRRSPGHVGRPEIPARRKCNPIRGDRITAYGDAGKTVIGQPVLAGFDAYQAATPPSERGSLPPCNTPFASRRIAPAWPTVSS